MSLGRARGVTAPLVLLSLGGAVAPLVRPGSPMAAHVTAARDAGLSSRSAVAVTPTTSYPAAPI